MAEKIVLKATKDAPEFIGQGVHDAALEDGYYRTNNRAFADHIIDNGYALEVEEKEATKEESDAIESDKGVTTNV